MSNSLRLHGLQPTRLLRPWDFPGKSTGVGCHCLLCRDDNLKVNTKNLFFFCFLCNKKFCHFQITINNIVIVYNNKIKQHFIVNKDATKSKSFWTQTKKMGRTCMGEILAIRFCSSPNPNPSSIPPPPLSLRPLDLNLAGTTLLRDDPGVLGFFGESGE